jgi:pimeloyl-ACP methyl ester carboxylesterase
MITRTRSQRLLRRLASLACILLLIDGAAAHAGYAHTSLVVPAGKSHGFPVPNAFEYSINVESYVSTSPCAPHAHNVFFVHGFGDNSGLFAPLAIALIEAGKACRTLAIDLPAHGASTVSSDPVFGPPVWGKIDVVDYADVVDQVLSTLHQQHILVDTIVGHSTGGLIVQRLQALYAARQGASLKSRFGIDRTILIASDLPRALPWASGDAPIAAGLAKGLVVSLAQTMPLPIGTRVLLDYNAYIGLKYSVNGIPVSGAPSPNAASHLNDPEPYAAAANIVGLDPTGATTNTAPRLYIPPALWNDFNLTVIWPDKDLFFMQSEMDGLAAYLKPGTQAIVLSDPEACHAIQFTKPELLVPFF